MKSIIKYIVKFFKYIIEFIGFVISKLFIVIKFLLMELFILIKHMIIGILKFLDFTITNLISLFSYIGYGVLIVFKFLYKVIYNIIYYIYKYLLSFIIKELYNLLIALYYGAFSTFKLLFYEIPVYLVNKILCFINFLKRRFKSSNEIIITFFKNLPKNIKAYFIKKWNNLAIVKHYKNKRERELEILFVNKFGKDAERSEKKRTYRYLVRDQNNKLKRGYFGGFSKLDVNSYLLDEGYKVYEIETNWWINFVHGESKLSHVTMKSKDLIFWLTQLSTYIKSGIPLTEAVKTLSEQDKRRRYKKIYDSLTYELTMGESFSEALKKQNEAFPSLLINMIKASEMTGSIEDALDEMSDYYSEQQKTKDAFISAMIYPAIICIFAFAAISFLVLMVIPKFVGIYESLNANVSGITLIVLNVSLWLKNNFVYLVLGIFGIIILYKILYKNVKAFRTMMQYILMHIPVIGKLIIYKEMTLFAKTFAVLNKNDVLLTDSIDLLSRLTNNEIYKLLMYDTISNLLRGDKMSLSFKDNWAVPKIAYYMITTGESTGDISDMLTKVSEFYRIQSENLSNRIKMFIEPLLIAILAVIVGVILLAVMMPMFQIASEVLESQ